MSDKHTPTAPSDWHEAFAALPLEHPPGEGWSRVAGSLAPRRPARRRVLPWAAAAAMACLAAVPGLILLRSPAPSMPAPAAVETATALDASSADASSPTQAEPSIGNQPDSGSATAPAPPALAAASPTHASTAHVSSTPGDTDPGQAALERLYAESARLEDLLGRIQGPRATNAGMEAATQQLAGTVGAIDTALADASLDPQGRQALWRERNALLDQLLTLELQHELLSRQSIAPFDFAQVN